MTPMILDDALQAGAVVATLFGMWLIGNRDRSGLLISQVGNVCWALLYVRHGLWGALIVPVTMAALYLRAWRQWGWS